jgi:hypothetical protein
VIPDEDEISVVLCEYKPGAQTGPEIAEAQELGNLAERHNRSADRSTARGYTRIVVPRLELYVKGKVVLHDDCEPNCYVGSTIALGLNRITVRVSNSKTVGN